MRVTVITPSRNQGSYIDHCLRSVHQQTHKDVEHLVLDGLSTDETAEVAGRYPCTFLQRRDSGPAQAINKGLELATGDIVCWLNADDAFFSPTTLECVVDLFTKEPTVDVITGNGYYIEESGRYLAPIIPASPSRMSLSWLRRMDFFLQPATFWRRNAFRLDEGLQYTFDWKLWIDFLTTGLNLLYVPEYFALYRVQPASLTQTDTSKRRREIYRLVKDYSPSKLQTAWCWTVWKLYVLSELLGSRSLKAIVRKANSLMETVSQGRIAS